MHGFSLRRFTRFASILATLGLTFAVFQNCSEKVEFSTIKKINSITGTEEEPQYNEMKVGDGKSFPPLKLFFIVDNSGTMQANQISLSTAFSKMFSDDNADNLAPFESTAYVFNTAQASMKLNDAMYPRLPKNEWSFYSNLTMDQLLAGPRAMTLDGQIAGDLVGYRAVETQTNDLKSLVFEPSAVPDFKFDIDRLVASEGVVKLKGGSVSELNTAFGKRIGILNPARSAMDPILRTGVLDSVIDKESGLCAAARIMRNKEKYIKPGDIAAFIIVSDEDDADAKGVNCVQSYKDYQGNEEYFDGYCTTAKTSLTYRDINPNPSEANCSVDYSTGYKYNYTYELPKTDASFYIQQRDYVVRQTIVSYKAATHTFTQPRVTVSYHTKAPTYKVPQSTFTYFKLGEVCDIRDGVKFNCKNTYPKFTSSVYEEAYAVCKDFTAAKLPADAILNNANYPVECQMLTPAARTGPCSIADATKLDCKQNYSLNRTTTAPINGMANAAQCAAFAVASAGLPANAVINDAGYEVMCADASLPNVAGNGMCPTMAPLKQDCLNIKTEKTSVAIDGVPINAPNHTDAQCMTFAKAKKSSLVANAVFDDQTGYPITCVETAAGKAVINSEGTCASIDANPALYKNCTPHNAATRVNQTYNGEPTAGTPAACKSFIQTAIGANRVISENPVPTCVRSALVQTVAVNDRAILYADMPGEAFTPAVGDSCLATLQSYIATKDNVPAPKTCVVAAITRGNFMHNTNMLCGQVTTPNLPCTGTTAKRECVARDVPAGDMFMAKATTAIANGTFTCDTLCSDTGFCKTKPGTVKDNFKDCMTAPANTNRNFVRELYKDKDKVCVAPEMPTPTTTRNPYKETGNKTDYVAGDGSKNGMPDALANYIRDQSVATFGTELPAVSVFVRQSTDSLGTNGSYGTAYNTFADLMGGQKKSVLSSSTGYADALQSLSTVIKDKLTRSFNVPVQAHATVHRVWHRKAGATKWGTPIDSSNWTAVGGTVTISPTYVFEYGDEFRMESY